MVSKKIGRNDPCPCGSGKKYKKCHGRDMRVPFAIPVEVTEHFRRVESERQLLRDQGLYIDVVKPVIFQGRKVWALGSRVYPNRPPNETFHEFIIHILALTLGQEWWEAQLAEEENRRHFIMRCFKKYSAWHKASAKPENQVATGVWAAFPDGWSRSLVSLAWDVCSLLHASYIPEQLLNRLKQRDGYQGARYELSIAAIFARLGFKIEFLDETAAATKHCEFFANHTSGLSIGVEAKSRHRAGIIHTVGASEPKGLLKGGGLTRLLNRALRQNPGDRPFIVFVDVNAPQTPSVPVPEKPWFKDVRKLMDRFHIPTPEDPDPVTGVFFTNYSFHYQLENQADPGEYLMIIPKYAKHPIAEGWVLTGLEAALKNYGNVPPIDVEERALVT